MTRRRSRSRSRKPSPPQPLRDPVESSPALPEILDRIDRWLYRRRRRMRLALRPGLPPAALEELRCRLNDTLPEELAQLLAWHDGQDPDFAGTFADGWSLLRGEDIPPLKADLDGDPPPGWQPGWVPWARTANDSFLALAPTPPDHPVRAVWLGQSDPPVVAPSLTAWFATFLADIEAGNYAEDAERGTFLNTRTAG